MARARACGIADHITGIGIRTSITSSISISAPERQQLHAVAVGAAALVEEALACRA